MRMGMGDAFQGLPPRPLTALHNWFSSDRKPLGEEREGGGGGGVEGGPSVLVEPTGVEGGADAEEGECTGVLGLPACVGEMLLRGMDADGLRVLRQVSRSVGDL